jgi:RNA 2',3'-cyclic 3'-phosphodiesterase
MGVFRAFIPIELPDRIRILLGQVIDQLESQVPEGSVRWVPPENVHLTLKFLGDVSESNYEVLTTLLETQSQHYQPFNISVGGLGSYPNEKRPRVIWIGVEAKSELYSLQKSIDAETVRLGYASEARDYTPHLTVGRVSRNLPSQEIRTIGDTITKFEVGFLGVVQVEALHLYRSDLKPGGAVYTRLFTARLGMDNI